MQSWDRRTSQAFIWGRTVFVSLFGSMRLLISRVSDQHLTHTNTRKYMHVRTHAQTHFCTRVSAHGLIDSAASLFWLWVSGAQLVLETGGLAELCSRQQTHIQRHTHAVPGTHCARLQRLPATSHKERQRQRRKGRTKCVWEGGGRF